MASPSCAWCPRPCVGVPLVVYPVALLNGGCGGACCPRVRIGSSPSHCSRPSCIVLPLLHCLFYPLILVSTVRVLCHSIVGLVLCFCDRVVSLWNTGGDLYGVEGRVVFTVSCRLLYVVVCVSVRCVRCVCCLVVRCCGLWNGGGWGGCEDAWSLRRSLCPLLLLFLLCLFCLWCSG